MNKSMLVSLLLTPATLFAQDPMGTPREAWDAFLSTHGPGWTAEWNAATGTPEAIYGKGLLVKKGRVEQLAEARRFADAVLENHAALLGTGPSSFREDIGATVTGVHVFVYDQWFRGLQVLGGRADVRVHSAGRVSMFGSKAVPIENDFGTTPAITADHARALAYAHLKLDPKGVGAAAPGQPAGHRLVIYANVELAQPAAPRLAWEIQVDDRRSATDLTVGKAFVDAKTGTILEWRSEVYSCWAGHVHVRGESAHTPRSRHLERLTGALAKRREAGDAPEGAPRADIIGNVLAWTNLGLSPLDPLTNVPLEGIRVTAQGIGSAFTDQNGDFRIPHSGTNPVTVSVDFGTGSGEHLQGGISPSQGQPISTSATATPGVPVQLQLLTASATENEWSQTTIFWWTDQVNRYYRNLVGNLGGMNTISQVRATANRSQTCNAFYTNNSINFFARGGQCNMTAFSTVVDHEWGHGIDDAFGGISQTDGLSEGWGDAIAIYHVEDPVVGKDFLTNGGFVRTALNTRTYPAGGGVHQQGETWMGFAWDLRNNLIASLGQAAGDLRAEQIFLPSIVANATNQPNAVREVFILDDDDGDLRNGTPNYAAIEAACIKRNLPYPQIDPGTIAHTPLVDTGDIDEPQLVIADAQPIVGNFTRLDVVYDVGNGTQRREMMPTGNGNEHVALIPGVVSGTVVTYHIEGQHSVGRTIRQPESGTLSYLVGLDTILSEDFENGANGWTHGSIAGTDDWQLGAPAGKGGTANGRAWRDPSSAASGTSAWGNDLGNGANDGAYPASTVNWLRSPAYDMSGVTGVRLRFKRWLNVDAGLWDRASIWVNGSRVWVNSFGSFILDTQWIDFELPLPSADNNPSVTIEWRIESDPAFNFGGWNIDDVELTGFRSQPYEARYRINPAQIPINTNAQATISGASNAAAAVLLSATQGPTNIPGIPTLHVGPGFTAVPVMLDAGGNLAFQFPAPTGTGAIGKVFYSHVLQLDGTQLGTSNKMVLLFGR